MRFSSFVSVFLSNLLMLGAESSEEFDPKAGIPHSFMVVTHKALTASEISRDFDWTGYEEDIFKPSETTVHKRRSAWQ